MYVCTQLTKAYVAETSCISCYWFCYVSAHDQFAQYVCVCMCVCRMTPGQKAETVKIVKKFDRKSTTLAVGDGANDVSMIQVRQ